MNIDQKIKQVLDRESAQIDEMMLDEKGIFGMMGASMKGGNRYWLIVVYIVGFACALAMAWTAYHFWIAESEKQMIFYGFCFLTAMLAQLGLKLWGFMEMNRTSMVREIKRVELQIARLRASEEAK